MAVATGCRRTENFVTCRGRRGKAPCRPARGPKGKARAWCSEWDGITALAPLIGARAARSLQVTRGVEDFPGPVSFEDIDDWDSDSDSDSGYSDSGVNLD